MCANIGAGIAAQRETSVIVFVPSHLKFTAMRMRWVIISSSVVIVVVVVVVFGVLARVSESARARALNMLMVNCPDKHNWMDHSMRSINTSIDCCSLRFALAVVFHLSFITYILHFFFFSPSFSVCFWRYERFAVSVVEWIWCDFELRVCFSGGTFSHRHPTISLSATIMTRTHFVPRHRAHCHRWKYVRVPRALSADTGPVLVHTKCNGSQTTASTRLAILCKSLESIGDAMASCGSVRAIRVNLIASFVRSRRYSTAKPVSVVVLMDGKNESAARLQRWRVHRCLVLIWLCAWYLLCHSEMTMWTMHSALLWSIR